MRTPTKWIVAGGAAALVLTPIATVSGSMPMEEELSRSGVVVDAEAANRARTARTTTEAATRTAEPTAAATGQATARTTTKSTGKASVEPKGKKTVSAASPVSPKTSVSPHTPD